MKKSNPIRNIGRAMMNEKIRAENVALRALENFNIKPGSRVRRFTFDGKPDGDFIVAEISTKYESLYLSGRKVRRDGTIGDHIHPISAADEVQVLAYTP